MSERKVSLEQRDGVAVMLGHLTNLATLIYFGILISGSGYAVKRLLT